MHEIPFELVEQFIVDYFEVGVEQAVLNISVGHEQEINISRVSSNIYHAVTMDYLEECDTTEILTSKESIIEFIKKIESKTKVWYEAGEFMAPVTIWEDHDFDHVFDPSIFRT